MWRVAHVAVAATLLALAGCGGDENIVERSDFILELENALDEHLDEPTIFGQAGLTPTGDDQTRIAIRLDEPFEPAEAEIHRGGCVPFSRGLSVYRLGEVEDRELEAVVDAPLRELREGGYVLVVRGPLPTGGRLGRDEEPPKGVCGDFASVEPID
jgi:hypothetical protein